MEKHRLSDDIRALLTSHDGDIVLGELLQQIGDRGFGMFFIMLSLPSALPIPAAGYSTPFGIMMMLLALQMMMGRKTPWLPERAMKAKVSRKVTGFMNRGVVGFLRQFEHLVRPRFAWASGRAGLVFAAVIIICMAGLMIIPIPGTNTAPAIVIFLVGVAITEKDGLALMLTTLMGCCAAALYVAVIYAIVNFSAEGLTDALRILWEKLSSVL